MKYDKLLKYYRLAESLAVLFSKDPCKKVGAIILAPDSYQILSTGYNGFPRKINESNEKRWEKPIKYKYVEHAERNALYNACRSGVSLDKSIAIVTHFPCHDCARGLIQSGVKVVVTKRVKDDSNWVESCLFALELFNEAHVEIVYVKN